MKERMNEFNGTQFGGVAQMMKAELYIRPDSDDNMAHAWFLYLFFFKNADISDPNVSVCGFTAHDAKLVAISFRYLATLVTLAL